MSSCRSLPGRHSATAAATSNRGSDTQQQQHHASKTNSPNPTSPPGAFRSWFEREDLNGQNLDFVLSLPPCPQGRARRSIASQYRSEEIAATQYHCGIEPRPGTSAEPKEELSPYRGEWQRQPGVEAECATNRSPEVCGVSDWQSDSGNHRPYGLLSGDKTQQYGTAVSNGPRSDQPDRFLQSGPADAAMGLTPAQRGERECQFGSSAEKEPAPGQRVLQNSSPMNYIHGTPLAPTNLVPGLYTQPMNFVHGNLPQLVSEYGYVAPPVPVASENRMPSPTPSWLNSSVTATSASNTTRESARPCIRVDIPTADPTVTGQKLRTRRQTIRWVCLGTLYLLTLIVVGE